MMPPAELRPVIERVYWNTVGMLAEEPEEIDEPEAAVLHSTATACPAILARLTEHGDLPGADDLLYRCPRIDITRIAYDAYKGTARSPQFPSPAAAAGEGKAKANLPTFGFDVLHPAFGTL